MGDITASLLTSFAMSFLAHPSCVFRCVLVTSSAVSSHLAMMLLVTFFTQPLNLKRFVVILMVTVHSFELAATCAPARRDKLAS